MSHGRGWEAYERAVNDLLDALAEVGNPRISEERQKAARQWAVEAALAARYAALTVHEEEAEIDLWVPPHLRPQETNRNYRLPLSDQQADPNPEATQSLARDVT